jgi:hypothetical protein
MTTATKPSKIHSHSGEDPDSLAAGDADTATGDCGLGDGAGAPADPVTTGWLVTAADETGETGAVAGGGVAGGAVVGGAVVGGAVVAGSAVAGVAGSVAGAGGLVLGDRVGGDSVGRETAGGEMVILLLAAALDRALLRLPPPQPATEPPAATITSPRTSFTSSLLMAGPLIHPGHGGRRKPEQ